MLPRTTGALEHGHDPTVIESRDGYSFTPTSWVEFLNSKNQRIEQFGDADILQTTDGRLLRYCSSKSSPEVKVSERQN